MKLAVTLTALLSIVVLGCAKQIPLARVVVANSAETERVDERVDLQIVDLGLPLGDASAEGIEAFSDGKSLPAQAWDKNGDGIADTLSVLLDLAPAERKSLELRLASDKPAIFKQRTQAEISRKTGGEWQDRKYVGGYFENVQLVETPPETPITLGVFVTKVPDGRATRLATVSIWTGETASIFLGN